MKYFNYKIILSAIFILALSFLNAQKIVHLEGSYDLDGDNLLEFISLELDPDKNVFPTVVKYNDCLLYTSPSPRDRG